MPCSDHQRAGTAPMICFNLNNLSVPGFFYLFPLSWKIPLDPDAFINFYLHWWQGLKKQFYHFNLIACLIWSFIYPAFRLTAVGRSGLEISSSLLRPTCSVQTGARVAGEVP